MESYIQTISTNHFHRIKFPKKVNFTKCVLNPALSSVHTVWHYFDKKIVLFKHPNIFFANIKIYSTGICAKIKFSTYLTALLCIKIASIPPLHGWIERGNHTRTNDEQQKTRTNQYKQTASNGDELTACHTNTQSQSNNNKLMSTNWRHNETLNGAATAHSYMHCTHSTKEKKYNNKIMRGKKAYRHSHMFTFFLLLSLLHVQNKIKNNDNVITSAATGYQSAFIHCDCFFLVLRKDFLIEKKIKKMNV